MKRLSQRMSKDMESIYQAIGEAASLHWPASKEVFKSDEAKRISEQLATSLRISSRMKTASFSIFEKQFDRLTMQNLGIGKESFVAEIPYLYWLGGFDLKDQFDRGRTPEEAYKEFLITNHSGLKTPQKINQLYEEGKIRKKRTKS